MGRVLGQSTSLPVLWIEQAELPKSLASHFPQQFPPLRVDRDTVIVGQSTGIATAGKIQLHASSAGQAVDISWDAEPESSNPDMGFLASVTAQAARDGGLTLPALGSDGLRAMSFMLADSATEMVKSGQFALRAGQVDTAIRIAEEALKNDPNNAEAVSLLNAAQKQAGSAVPTGKFTQFGGAASDNSGFSALDETLGAGDLLAEEQAMRRAASQALEADVRQQLRVAQEQSGRDPTGVKNSLKLLLEELDSAVDLDAALRAQLQQHVRSAIQIAALKEARYLDRVQQAETVRSQADQAMRLLAETDRREESLKQLVEQFNFLMTSEEYLAASKEVAPEIGIISPNSTLHVVTREESSMASNEALLKKVFEAREQGVVDALRGVEEAAVAFDGVPPLVYPAPEVWQALSARRKERYGSINLAGGNDTEQRIYSALKQSVTPEYRQQPLQSIIDDLKDEYNIPIHINQTELAAVGVDPDFPIDLELPPLSLRSMLRLLFQQVDPPEVTYIIRDEVMLITSKDDAEAEPINKVYPVGDLVIPPTPMMGGGMGGMGGGMGGMGGGMGGMGGGMGGMGGGMGGMGGGMGGMGGGMGGMGGGMFAVPDDSTKSSEASPLALHQAGSSSNIDPWIERFAQCPEEDRPQLNEKLRSFVQGKVEVASAYLEINDQVQLTREFQEIVDLLNGLIAAGYPLPWMYQTLSLGMEACQYPDADIQRVLLSGLDFQGDTNHSFKLATYMAQRGMKQEALELLHDIAMVEPYRYDIYALALPLASELKDNEALRWTCKGILSKAWPIEQADLYQEARLLAIATQARLAQSGRVVESKAFEEEIRAAMVRDIAVRVNWSGQADLDIRVQEPAGTICSLSNPQTISGGVLLGDTSSASARATIDGYSEYYVCSEGYAGQYDILIRKIWGDVSGGKATVEIYTDFGTPEEQRIVKQIDVSERDAVVNVAVKNGHRVQPIAEAQLANIRQKQIKTSHAVLGQLAGDAASSDSSSNQAYDDFRQTLLNNARAARRGFGFPVGGGVVGYQPVITTIPEGASMFVTGVVSADRRYVRISPSPNFTGIGEISTFNFVSGGSTTTGGGTGTGTTGGQAGGAQGGVGF